MIRVAIADDEPLILKGLRKLIDWNALGMDIIAQANDGVELLAVLEAEQPDIVISDIAMPHLSGIDMIKEIHRKGLPTKVILISAFQDFSYAKDAIAFGAVEYLVKPVVKRELEQALAKAVAYLSQQSEQVRAKDKLEFLEQRSRDEELREAFDRLTSGELPAKSEKYRMLECAFASPRHSVGLVEIEHMNESSGRWPEQERKLAAFAVENVAAELLLRFGKGRMFAKEGKLAFALGHDDPGAPLAFAEQLRGNVQDYLKLNVSIGVGRPVAELSSLPLSYRDAQQALLSKYFLGLGRVIPHRGEEAKTPGTEEELHLRRAEVVRGMNAGDWGAAKAAADLMLEAIRQTTFGNPSLAMSACFSAVLTIVQEVKDAGIELSNGGFDIHDLQSRLERYDTFDELKAGVLDVLEKLYQRTNDRAGNKEKLLMARVKQYIDEHYAEDISLESVASIAFMNPYYFSSFFKKHTGQNFKPYVTEVRMKHALRLLSQSDLMVYEVAEKVGYHNARHFSDMFKKQFGILPQQYKQNTSHSE